MLWIEKLPAAVHSNKYSSSLLMPQEWVFVFPSSEGLSVHYTAVLFFFNNTWALVFAVEMDSSS